MYHSRFRGTHADIGHKWGSLLKKNGRHLLDNIPYRLTEELRNYAKECLPLYEMYCPHIVMEIQGIASGQGIAAEQLFAVLFPMYTMVTVTNCSSFIVKNQNELLLGRNSDFLTAIEKLYTNCIYRFDDPDTYDFNANTTAFVEMEDGINSQGMALALTSVYPKEIKPGIHVGILLRMILEKAATVAEAIEIIENTPRSSSGTLMLSDAAGAASLVEFTCNRIAIKSLHEVGSLIATNAFHLPEMAPHRVQNIDDWFAEKRYQTMEQTLASTSESFDRNSAKDLLSGKNGFICQYDRNTGKDTVWSSIYDLKRKQIYRCEGNPGRKSFTLDNRFKMK